MELAQISVVMKKDIQNQISPLRTKFLLIIIVPYKSDVPWFALTIFWGFT